MFKSAKKIEDCILRNLRVAEEIIDNESIVDYQKHLLLEEISETNKALVHAKVLLYLEIVMIIVTAVNIASLVVRWL